MPPKQSASSTALTCFACNSSVTKSALPAGRPSDTVRVVNWLITLCSYLRIEVPVSLRNLGEAETAVKSLVLCQECNVDLALIGQIHQNVELLTSQIYHLAYKVVERSIIFENGKTVPKSPPLLKRNPSVGTSIRDKFCPSVVIEPLNTEYPEAEARGIPSGTAIENFQAADKTDTTSAAGRDFIEVVRYDDDLAVQLVADALSPTDNPVEYEGPPITSVEMTSNVPTPLKDYVPEESISSSDEDSVYSPDDESDGEQISCDSEGSSVTNDTELKPQALEDILEEASGEKEDSPVRAKKHSRKGGRQIVIENGVRYRLNKRVIQREGGENPFICVKCNFAASKLQRVRDHIRLSHIGDYAPHGKKKDKKAKKVVHPPPPRGYLCRVCENRFPSKEDLRTHSDIHKSERRYMCDECGKSFRANHELQEHKGGVHATDRPFPCNICDKKFNTKKNLKKHLFVHSDVKKYQCDACGRQFRFISGLYTHQRTIHGDGDEEKKFGCDVCGKRFRIQARLLYHLPVHGNEKSFECTICGEKFRTRSTLNSHKGKHADPSTLTCNICGKKLSDAKNMKRHVKLMHPNHVDIGQQEQDKATEADQTV